MLDTFIQCIWEPNTLMVQTSSVKRTRLKNCKWQLMLITKVFLKSKFHNFIYLFIYFGHNQGIVNNLKISNKYRPNPPSVGSV